MKVAVLLYTPALLVLLSTVARAQDSSAIRADSLLTTRLIFSRALDIYHWQVQAAYTQVIVPRTIFRFGENFLSSLHRLSSQDKWKDDQTATLGIDFDVLGVPAQAQIYSRLFRDQFSSFNSEYNSTGAQVGWRQQTWQRFEIQPGVGYRWESRLERTDNGPHFEFGARLPETEISGYTHQLTGLAATDRFPSRKNEDVRFNYSLARQFYTDTSDSLFLTFAHFRRDNYVNDRTQIRVEQLSKRTRGIENRLRYRLSGSGRLALRSLVQESRVAIRKVEIEDARSRDDKNLGERAHDDFDVQHVLSLDWQWPKFSTGLEFRFEQQTVDFNIPDSAGFSPFSPQFVIIRYNVRGRTYAISQRSNWQASSRDSLRLSGSVVRFARDTSEKNRPDSYDNFRAQLSLVHQHVFRRDLALRWQLSGYADHFVYLKSAFSATNNWTRILQLAPQILFRVSESVRASQRFGVRAHYVTYDFEQIPGTLQSFSSRTFFVTDSLAVQLTQRSTMALQYSLELEEIGSLNWSEFATRPQLTRHRHWFYLTFDHALAPRWRFSPGLSFYHQTQWRHEATPRGLERRRSTQITSVGPQVRLSYERAPHALLYFQGQQQMIFSLGGRRQNQYYFNLTVQLAL